MYKSAKVISVLAVVIVFICIAVSNNWIGSNNAQEKIFVEKEEIISLDIKENAYVGVNNNQVYKVTRDGIKVYNLDKQEIWSDTFTLGEVVVKQKEPYIAIGSKNGKSIHLFNEKGKQAEVNTQSQIVFFSINQNGNLVVIEEEENKHHVTAYSKTGEFLCTRTSFIETDGYPVAAEVSPEGDILLISYINVSEPEVTSTIICMDTKNNENKELDNVTYGITEKDNLVYSILFLSNDIWVSVGDKYINWYNKAGDHKVKKEGLYSIYAPSVPSVGVFGDGYLPLIVSGKPIQSTVHQDERLVVLDDEGNEIFSHDIEETSGNLSVNKQTIVYQTGGQYEGYNRLGNKLFTYSPTIDVDKVIYLPDSKQGVAISKEKVMILSTESKGEKK